MRYFVNPNGSYRVVFRISDDTEAVMGYALDHELTVLGWTVIPVGNKTTLLERYEDGTVVEIWTGREEIF